LHLAFTEDVPVEAETQGHQRNLARLRLRGRLLCVVHLALYMRM
jgi:hypothetical protein